LVGDRAVYTRTAILLCMLASVLSLVLRYRRSRGDERQQIKWITYAASLVGLLYLIAMIGSFVYRQETWFAPGSPLWLNLHEYTIRSTQSVGRP
jgi:heme A synthase